VRATFASLLVGVSVFGAGVARADDELQLSWVAPAACPKGADVRAAALRGAAGGQREAGALEAEARVEKVEDRWRVTLRTRRAGVSSPERKLEAASCDALAEATGVILAMALLPPGASPPGESETAPEGPKAAPPPASPTSPRDAREAGGQPAREEAYLHRVAIGASAVGDGVALPSLAVGGGVSLAATFDRLRLEGGAAYFSGQSRTTGTSAAGASFDAASASGRACWAILRGAAELSPCAGADVTFSSGTGFGAAENYTPSATWVSVAGGGLLRVPLTSFLALRAELAALVPLTRPRFVVDGDGTVYGPPAMGARGTIGAEILFF